MNASNPWASRIESAAIAHGFKAFMDFGEARNVFQIEPFGCGRRGVFSAAKKDWALPRSDFLRRRRLIHEQPVREDAADEDGADDTERERE